MPRFRDAVTERLELLPDHRDRGPAVFRGRRGDRLLERRAEGLRVRSLGPTGVGIRGPLRAGWIACSASACFQAARFWLVKSP